MTYKFNLKKLDIGIYDEFVFFCWKQEIDDFQEENILKLNLYVI